MSRGLGVTEAVHTALPEWLVLVFGLITQLGDTWFLWLLLGVVYWRRPTDRMETLVVIALGLVGTAVVQVLKVALALPRPPSAMADPAGLTGLAGMLYDVTVATGGYGFPSGHAVGAAVIYLGLVTLLPRRRRRQWIGAGLGMVVLIAASRVLIGVHYLVDVLLGGLLGGIVVGVGILGYRRFGARTISVAFLIAVGIAMVNLGLRGVAFESVLLAGGSVAALAVWWQGGRLLQVRRPTA